MGKKFVFPKKFKEYRKRKGFTQAQMAEKLQEIAGIQLNPNTISNYETGTSTPSLQLLPFIAEILEIPVNALLAEDEQASYSRKQEIPQDKKINIKKIEDKLAAIELLYKQAPEEAYKEIVLLCRDLIGSIEMLQEDKLVLYAKLDSFREMVDKFIKKGEI